MLSKDFKDRVFDEYNRVRMKVHSLAGVLENYEENLDLHDGILHMQFSLKIEDNEDNKE